MTAKSALIVNPYWDSLGGGERYTAAFVRLLLNGGYGVDLLWPKDITPQVKNHFGIDISGVRFIDKFSRYAAGCPLVFWVSDGSLPTSLAAKTIIHFQFPFRDVNGRSLFNLAKSRFYTFVCNSGFTKSIIDREFAVSSQVIYPPVNTADFPPGKKTDTILYVGRFSHLTQAKNPRLLIESFRRISPRLPGWRLILAGGAGVGTPPGEIAGLRRLAGGAPVEIITNPPLDRLRRLYARAKIFWSASGLGFDPAVQPLKVEHFGISLVEAMAAGCVPIVSRLGGHVEIVDYNKTGFLYDSLSQLESLTLKLTADLPRLRALSTAATAASRKFDVSEFNRQFLKLI